MPFTTVFDEVIDSPCAGCVVRDNTKFKEGRIWQSERWDLSQDFEIAYPGMLVISPMRHVCNYMDLTEAEINELRQIIIECKKAVIKIFNCHKMAYMFYEKNDGHVHFVIIPLHGIIEIEDKYAVLGELMNKNAALKSDPYNMRQVREAIASFRGHFAAWKK